MIRLLRMHVTMIIQSCMEVIHRYKGFYPFSLEHAQRTFLEVLLPNLTEAQLAHHKHHYQLLKQHPPSTLVKLAKIYKQDCNLHLLYEYLPFSLEHYLRNNHRSPTLIYSQLTDSVATIVEALVDLQVKTDIFIQNLVVADLEKGQLRLFLEPSAEFTAAEDLARAAENKQSLMYFYEAEKKRVAMEIEELLEKHFGQGCVNSEANCPNFVISGSKLVFLPKAEPEEKRREVGKSPMRSNKDCFKRELKQKNLKKIEEIKGVLSRLQAKHPLAHQCKGYPETPDEIVFRPEEITNDKTAVLEENEYLQSLESELEKLHEQKAKAVRGSSEEKRSEMIKQISELQERSRNDRTSNSDEAAPRLSEKKSDKPNKYKMKITTSHQIEIQGKGEPQSRPVDQESIDQVRSGKVSLSELSQKPARPKTVKLQVQQPRGETKRERAEQARLNSRNSDIASKSRTINEIMEKINSKTNIAPLSSSAHQQPQPPDQHQQTHAQSYLQKIRSAKQKAEQVLKDYKKKH